MRSFLAALARPRPLNHDLTSTTHVDLYDYQLNGQEGADVVLRRIRHTPKATHITLGHNPLGDSGVASIIRYLCRPENSVPVEEINLNNCGIGDSGLYVISQYVKHNTTLQRLYLMGNQINGTSTVAKVFADALNHSKVRTLVLTNNELLSDNFLIRFLGELHTPYLRDLQLSRLGLTESSIPALSRFLESSACYGLRSLHLNANMLSYIGLHKLVNNSLTKNTTLCEMEIYANSVIGPGGGAGDDTAIRDTTLQVLAPRLARNLVYLRRVEREARALLVIARTVLFGEEGCVQLNSSDLPTFPWRKLAPELQLYILRFMYTDLSDAQHTRVCNYASNRSTLPPILSLNRHTKSSREWIEDFLIVVGYNRFEGALF
ncbi:hypothetical protein FS749_004500 [Ceratobasidium sp. UAMH 11750]|nr:hypothetical protein FS749_004500 [Ceratobasidium sp. UAMH 11750]